MPRLPVLPVLAAMLLGACGGGGGGAPTPTATSAAQSPTPCGAAAPAAPTALRADDWPGYHRSPDRTGVDVSSPPLTSLAVAWRVRLDGRLLAQPLLLGGWVIAATENDTVWALSAATGCTVWRSSVGTPVSSSGLQCPATFLGPTVGITATPVADPGAGRLYVAAFTAPGSNQLITLSLRDGKVLRRTPVDDAGGDPAVQLMRGALALSGGTVVATMGGRAGDCGDFHGAVIAVDTATGAMHFWRPTTYDGGIWQPGGVVVLPGGDLLVAVGNGESETEQDGGNSVVRLRPDLTTVDAFMPANAPELNRSDTDLGSTTPALIDASTVVQVGKGAVAYVLDPGHLGGVDGERSMLTLQRCYAIGGTAAADGTVYIPCDHGIAALSVSGGTATQLWRGPDVRAGTPIVAGGAVWTYGFDKGELDALDPATGAVRAHLALGPGEHFVSPAAARGRLFLGAGTDLVAVSGV